MSIVLCNPNKLAPPCPVLPCSSRTFSYLSVCDCTGHYLAAVVVLLCCFGVLGLVAHKPDFHQVLVRVTKRAEGSLPLLPNPKVMKLKERGSL